MRIETDSDYYYAVLNILERLRDEVRLKYGSLAKGSKKLGKSCTYLNKIDIIGSVRHLDDVCKILDIDLEYLIERKENTGHYRNKELSFKKLLSVYKENIYNFRKTASMKTIASGINKGRCNIKIATLLQWADLFRVSPIYLIYE